MIIILLPVKINIIAKERLRMRSFNCEIKFSEERI